MYMNAYINNGRTASSVPMIELNVICKLIDLLTRAKALLQNLYMYTKFPTLSKKRTCIQKRDKIYTYSPRIILSTKYTLKFFFIENLEMFNGKNLKVENEFKKQNRESQ